jgi:hypothetical protein
MASVAAQTDTDVDVVIALDGLPASYFDAYAAWPRLHLRPVPPNLTPPEVRQWAWTPLIHDYDAIIFCDGDDVLQPRRVENARAGLAHADIDACALALVDAALAPLPYTITPSQAHLRALPFSNSFGLSNTAYTTRALAQLMAFPKSIVAVDWYLITHAYALGMTINTRADADMWYRQHGGNIASPLKPLTAQKLQANTHLVRGHLEAVLAADFLEPAARALYQQRLADVLTFQKAMTHSQDMIENYRATYNNTKTEIVWWNTVAHPQLEEIWGMSSSLVTG